MKPGDFTHPMSALLVNIEAGELKEQIPSLVDLFNEFPLMATLIEQCCNDVLACAMRDDDGRIVLDGTHLGIRLGAWRTLARNVLAISEDA